MFKSFNEKYNINKQIQRNSNSDLINIKDEYNNNSNFKTTNFSNNKNIENNNLNICNTLKAHKLNWKSLIQENITPKKKNSQKILKINNIKKNIEKRNNQTPNNFFLKRDLFFKTLNKIKNISVISKKRKINNPERKERNKENKENIDNKVIYYNSSIDDFYRKRKNELESTLNSKTKSSINIPKSNKVNFINNILNLYKIKNKDKKIGKISMRINLKKKISKTDETEEFNNKLLKGFNYLIANKSALKVLFKKKPIKIRNSLNPITNSYGTVLDALSGKIGFMKDSINLIYPKISKAKYSMNENKIEESLNGSNINDNNQEKISSIILYKINKRKINQTISSKYPVYITNKIKNNKISHAKMYSLRSKK